MTSTDKLLLTVAEAAALLSISTRDCQREIAEGHLAAVRLHGGQRVPRTAVAELVARLEREAAEDREHIRSLLERKRIRTA